MTKFGEWQPIETAPRTGKTIIGWSKYLIEPATFYWEERVNDKGWRPAHESGPIIEAQGDFGTEFKGYELLTHWMPLPEPPQ